MIEYEDIDFRASKYPPNPLEVTYWVDLSSDSNGNVIRSYDFNERKWVPLNRDTNTDLYKHLKLLVNALGFTWSEDIIELSDFNGTYFKEGETLTEVILKGDKAVEDAINAEMERAKKAEELETVDRTKIDTLHGEKLESLELNYEDLDLKYTQLQQSYSSLQQDVAALKSQLPKAEEDLAAQASDEQFDDLGLE